MFKNRFINLNYNVFQWSNLNNVKICRFVICKLIQCTDHPKVLTLDFFIYSFNMELSLSPLSWKITFFPFCLIYYVQFLQIWWFWSGWLILVHATIYRKKLFVFKVRSFCGFVFVVVCIFNLICTLTGR